MDDPKKEVYLKELELLRGELKDLKGCQVNYFTVSITATGLILGVIARFGSPDLSGLFYLLPLAILLPCWMVFFDKAKTITRAVSYYGLLEDIIIGEKECLIRYIGFENSLARYREYNNTKNKSNENQESNSKNSQSTKKANIKKALFDPVGSYWRIIYVSFASLSAICILISIAKEISNLNIINMGILIIISIIFSVIAIKVFFTYINLVDGKHSYTANKTEWIKALPKTFQKRNDLVYSIYQNT